MHRAFHPIFRGMSPDRLEDIQKSLQPFSYADGEVVYSEGEEPQGMYLIEEGKAQIFLAALGPQRRPETAMIKKAGDYFGEMSLLDQRRHLGTVTAMGTLKGWLLTKDSFFALAQSEPVFVLNLARDVVTRTRQADSQLILELARSKTAAELFIDRMKALADTSQAINSTLELDHLLGIILREATRHTNSAKGTIYLLDTASGELVSRVLRGDRVEEIRLPLGKGIAGYVAATGMTLNIPDAYQDERFNPEIDKKTGERTTSILAMPMLDPNREIVGVIQLLNKRDAAPFTHEDEDFIKAMSVHASIAIRNARLAEKMIQQESLAAVGNLAATIIHDLKSPITIIRGYTQLLETVYPEADAKRYTTAIEAQIDRMLSMTQEVLDFSRGEMKLQLFENGLFDYFKEMIDSIAEDLHSKNVTLNSTLPDPEYRALFDPNRVSRVFFNLVLNSRDAMPDGGEIEVIVSGNEDEWSMEVKDNGKGIPAHILPEIFEPFKTFGKKRGTGLGLAITKKVAEQHNGTVDVESKEGEGTHFTLVFPRHPERT